MRFMEAQSLWLQGDKARSDHFNGACMYRMGCCALDMGKNENAMFVEQHSSDRPLIDDFANNAPCIANTSTTL